MERPRVVVVSGPTASGKTDWAVELALHDPFELDQLVFHPGAPNRRSTITSTSGKLPALTIRSAIC